jgi:hypothetical protein
MPEYESSDILLTENDLGGDIKFDLDEEMKSPPKQEDPLSVSNTLYQQQ